VREKFLMKSRPSLLRSCVGVGLLLGCAAGCSASSDAPPFVQSSPSGATSSGGYPTPCPQTTDSGSGVFDFDAGFDAGLGIGTTNPSTPVQGGTAFSGDATVAPSAPTTPTTADAASPCPSS
jgi:hypothetical protein